MYFINYPPNHYHYRNAKARELPENATECSEKIAGSDFQLSTYESVEQHFCETYRK
jgi:hypothetical protein